MIANRHRDMKEFFKGAFILLGWYVAGVFLIAVCCSLFSCSTKKEVVKTQQEQIRTMVTYDGWTLAAKDSVMFRSMAMADSGWWELAKVGDTIKASGGFFGDALLPKRLRWQRRESTRYTRRHEGKLRPTAMRRPGGKYDLRRGRYISW